MRIAARLFWVATMLLVVSNALSQSQKKSTGINVIASIKPLALLVEPLLHESDRLDTLLAANASPHHFSLQVSHLRKLQDADLVVWIGADMERFLVKPLAKMPSASQLALVTQLSQDTSKTQVLTHSDAQDFHEWLSLQKAKVFTAQVSERLAALRPEREDYYIERAKAQLEDLQQLEVQLANIFLTSHTTGFVAYHPAYSELVSAYNLNQIGVVTTSPEIPVSARTLYELQTASRDGAAKCLFTELSHQSQAAEEIAQSLQLKLVVLDPLGQNRSTTSYQSLMLKLAQDMSTCLAD